VRAVLGQQVTVAAARKLASRLTEICGTALPNEQRTSRPELHLGFPSAAQLAQADLSALGMPRARKEALVALAQAALNDPSLFHPQGTVEETVARLRAIRGIGEWTAHYIALRAVRETDAFPASDIGLLRGAAIRVGTRPSPAVLQDRAETWRPWRAYAAQHLWAADQAAHG
jgi:AraC family transcriptional regulator, regulatory protein of adaptative response / DNA-3-methyladenine glycosylase II